MAKCVLSMDSDDGSSASVRRAAKTAATRNVHIFLYHSEAYTRIDCWLDCLYEKVAVAQNI